MAAKYEGPVLIQAAPNNSRRAPLFLIHDGSGTIFSYYLLESLGRAVYGIANPRAYDNHGWEGGLKEMAIEYLGMIRSIQPTGKILLGGWSLGGIVSFEIAHLLSLSPELGPRIIGLLLIDSVWPHSPKTAQLNSVTHTFDFPPHMRSDTILAIRRCMAESKVLVSGWEPQTWGETSPLPLSASQDSPTYGAKATKASCVKDYLTEHAIPKQAPVKNISGARPPPAILLRARDRVPTSGVEPSEICDIDIYREDPTLGWGNFGTKFIRKVLPVNGHHYVVFEDRNIESVHNMLHLGCRMLDAE